MHAGKEVIRVLKNEAGMIDFRFLYPFHLSNSFQPALQHIKTMYKHTSIVVEND